jgi:hypothetical protein
VEPDLERVRLEQAYTLAGQWSPTLKRATDDCNCEAKHRQYRTDEGHSIIVPPRKAPKALATFRAE